MRKVVLTACIILTLITGNLWTVTAMESVDRFKHYDEKDGVVNAIVSCTQDKQGFLWFGTEGGNGVFRYDGKSFRQFVHEPSNPNSIAPGNVYDIICDAQGQLWFATYGGGVSRYSPETGMFTTFTHQEGDTDSIGDNTVFGLFEDSRGDIWIATSKSLDRYTPSTGKISHFYPDIDDENMLQSTIIYHMFESSDGMIWFATYGGGLNMYDPVSGTFTVYRHDPDNPESLAHDTCGAVVEDENGDLWIGGKGGISRLNRVTGTFKRYQHDPEDEYTLADNYVWDMVFDDEGNLWTGGFGGGLGKMDPDTGIVQRYMHDVRNPDGLASNYIWFVYIDREDILWIGMPDGGVNSYAHSTAQFMHYRHTPGETNTFPVRSLITIFEDSENIFWVAGQGHDSGLAKWDRATGTLSVLQTDSTEGHQLPSGEILSIDEDLNGDLLIAQYGGLTRYDKKQGSWERIFPLGEDSIRYADIEVRKVTVDTQGDIWVATEIGLIYAPKGHEGYSILFEGVPMSTVYVDLSANVWVGTASDGLYMRPEGTEEWMEFRHSQEILNSLSKGQVNEIYRDSSNNLWIGTEGGLNLWNPKDSSFKIYSTGDGFSSNVIYSILEDEAGSLWMGTANGLIQFNPENYAVSNYYANNGLQGNEFSMRRNGAVAASDGNFYFVGKNGLSVFDPMAISPNQSLQGVMLTSVKVLNEEVDLGIAPFALDSLDLSWNDSMVSFDFISMNMANPDQIQYAYMLEGFDSDWIDSGNVPTATYTNLDGGNYTFRVKASIQPGVWSGGELALPVTVMNPWWETWWATMLYGLLIILAIYIYIQLRMRRLANTNKRLEHKVEERTEALAAANKELTISLESLERQSKELESTTRELMSKERLASLGNLVAGVAHEINTPLGVAVTASTYLTGKNDQAFEALQSGNLSKEGLVNYMKTVDESSEIVSANLMRASELVQSFKKIAVNQSSEMATYFNLTEYLHSIIMTLKHEFKQSSHEIEVNFQEEVWIDSYPSAFSQIFTNLIMNSLKHGFREGQSGKIRIGKELMKDGLILTYEDDGVGISEEHISKIFDPFYTTNQQGGGSGLGLSIIYNIVNDKLEGSISCQSESGEGTLFIITLPLTATAQKQPREEM